MLTEYKIISADEAELNELAAEGWRFTAVLIPGSQLLMEREGKSERGRVTVRV